MSDWVTFDCAARAVRAMDVTLSLETRSEHIARSKQAYVTQSDSKFKYPFVLGLLGRAARAVRAMGSQLKNRYSSEHIARSNRPESPDRRNNLYKVRQLE
jgi:hypothetical protein